MGTGQLGKVIAFRLIECRPQTGEPPEPSGFRGLLLILLHRDDESGKKCDAAKGER